MTHALDDLAARWREEATVFRRRGQEASAVMAESYAQELETVMREADLEALSLQQAADESGYSYSAIQKMVTKGELANAGDKHRPRVRRRDLPRKARRRSEDVSRDEPDLVGEILAHRA